MAMPRPASQTRLHKNSGGGNGLGDRAVSLPSLFPPVAGPGRGTYNGAYPGAYPPEKPLKRAPSELLLERRGAFGPTSQFSGELQRPQITAFLDLAQFSNHTETVVPVDQPLFSVTPPVVAFTDFEGLQTYEAMLTLRNQDHVARRIKVYPPDSPYFELAQGRSFGRNRKALGGMGDKVAPGMEVSYVVRFKPDATIDYSYDLVVITEREKFSVPIRASGGSALLDFPDVIHFGDDCVVGRKSERVVLVRNIGDRATKFVLRTSPPFSFVAPDGYLKEGEACQVSVFFAPDRVGTYECELHLKYEQLEACAHICGSAVNVNVSVSHSLLVGEDTYVGLETQGVVTIRNDSDVPLDFSWRLFPSVAEERSHREGLQAKLKRREVEDRQGAAHSADTSEDSDSEAEQHLARRDAKITHELSRKYGSLNKAAQEDPLLFHDPIFGIEPLTGSIWSHSQISCACSFSPKDALVYQCTAYLQCAGQEERSPLNLKGLGIGPKATFSYDELDVGSVFVESAHRYEVQLLNQGDIEVEFKLIQRDTPGSARFQFEPSSGTIAVGSQCEIVVNFRPDVLGPFREVFEWTLKGRSTAVTLAFCGHTVQPRIEFDTNGINFGVVSFGFLNSRMLTLTNTSEVPCIYTLRIPGDDAPPNKEFDIIPSKGTLLPNCAQKVQIDFVSSTEKNYDLRLAVDLKGVGQEILSIPVTAKCAVPLVSFEPHGCLSYGDIFIRYPFHQSLYLHNTSTLPARFEVLPQDDKSRAEFEPDQWTGSVPPCASHVITVTLTAHSQGPLRISMYVKIHGRAVPFPLVLIANSVGPRLLVDPPTLDWGPAKCLVPEQRHVRLTNNSCIDATVRAFMNEQRSLWSVHPKIIHLSPLETVQLVVTLNIDETTTMQDSLNLIVAEGNDLSVAVKGKGIDTPMRPDQPLDLIDFGTLFTTRTEPRDIVIKNHGQRARRIQWFREKEKDKNGKEKKESAKSSKQKDADDTQAPPVFRVEPESVVLDPKTAYRFTFLASSPTSGTVEETLLCNETVDKAGGLGKAIFRPHLTATFVAPQVRVSKPDIQFKFLWDKNKPVAPMTEALTLENPGPLDIRFKVEVQFPFSTDIDEGLIMAQGSQEILVDFEPAYKPDRKSGIVRQKLSILYDDHPASTHVELVGRVVWPNLELDTARLDFGTVLNEVSKKMEVKMTNPTQVAVSYRWCFLQDPTDPRTPASPTSQVMNTKSANPRGGGGGAANGAAALALGSQSHGGNPEDGDGQGVSSMAIGGFAAGTMGTGSASSEVMMADNVDVNQIFDILPIFGKLEPGETQVVSFTYYGLRDRTFKATAVCTVDGGPEYEVKLNGSAAPYDYNFNNNKTELDFGDIPFTEVGEQEVTIQNPGKVPLTFNFNLSLISRPFVVDAIPSSGTVKPDERTRINIRFRAGIPDQVVETVLVEIAHFEPTPLIIRGQGTFPGIVLGLPRQNEAEHILSLEEASRRVQGRLMQRSGSVMLPGSSGNLDLGGGGTARSLAAFTGLQRTATPQEAAHATVRSAKSASNNLLRTGHVQLPGKPDDEPAEPTPRSAVTDGTLSAVSKGTRAPRHENLDLNLELEVDRHCLCELLLTSNNSKQHKAPLALGATTTSTSLARSTARKTLNEPPPVTAAHYMCDFGHIALGQSNKRTVNVYNCCAEPVAFSIEAKRLKELGFLVEPEHVKPLPPGKSFAINVTATRPKEEDETTLEFEWNLPVRGGPNYKVQLIADFVLPDLVMSSKFIDFGRIIVGQKKCVTIEFRNVKSVPVEWTFVEPRDKYGKRPPPHQTLFDLSPASDVLMPGEKRYVVASFLPQAAQLYQGELQLRLRDNQKRKKITIVGRGDVLRVEVKPTSSYQLGPIMPSSEGCSQEFALYNPTDYAIEVYSTTFDQQYLEEERVLADYDGFRSGFAEMSVRQPGDGIWRKIASRVAEIWREQESEEKAAALEALAPEDEEVMDASPYPYRVAAQSRLNALVLGPPKAGISTLARRLADDDQRKLLHVDEAVEWALTDPRYLRSDRFVKKVCNHIDAGSAPSVNEVAHILRRRTELPDCNAGVIVDGLASKHLEPTQVIEAVVHAFCTEKLVVLPVELPRCGKHGAGTSAASTVPTDATAAANNVSGSKDASNPADEPKPPTPAGEKLGNYYKALQLKLVQHIEDLKSSLPTLEAARKAAEDAMVAPVDSGGGSAQGAKGNELTASTDPAGTLAAATTALEKARGELAQCEADISWTPPPVEGGEPPPEPPPDTKAKAKAKAKAGAKGAPPPEPPPDAPPRADPAVEQLAAIYAEQCAVAVATVEKCNTQAKEEEEERQRDQERKRRAKRAAAKLAAETVKKRPGMSSKFKRQEVPEDPTAADYQPSLDDWIPSVSLHGLQLSEPPFDVLVEMGRDRVPMPLFPEQAPPPAPTVVQIVMPPTARPESPAPANFSILTPPNPRSTSKEGIVGPDGLPVEATEAEERMHSGPTRWIIEPQTEQKLFVHYKSDEVAAHSATLSFDVVGAIASSPVPINVSGITALPGISDDPRLIFPRRKQRRPHDGYAVKSFVTSLGVYDFGPLLAGRDKASRASLQPASAEEGDGGSVAPEAQSNNNNPDDSAEQADPVDSRERGFIMKHAESIRIKNDSLFPANVTLGLASLGGDFAVDDEAPASMGAFLVEPDTFLLAVGEQTEVKLWCFPPDKGVFKDKLVARVEHNPKPVLFDLCGVGTVPGLSLDRDEVQFGRLMMNIRGEDQRVRLKNESKLPIRWQFVTTEAKVAEADASPVTPPVGKEAAKKSAPGKKGQEREEPDPNEAPPQVPEEFTVEPMDGTLGAGEERDVRIGFRASKAAAFQFEVRAETKDVEGFRPTWEEAGRIAVQAETFAVDTVIEPDPRESSLDFGTVLVNTVSQRTFDVVNRGRFPIRYELAVRRTFRDLLQIDKPKDELPPGQRCTITVTCTPLRVVEAINDREGIALQVFDTMSGISVDHKIPPLRVGVTALYNAFQVTPPRGLNFGPVERGETQVRIFTIRNVGIFPFDWCLFDQSDPPKIGDDGRPPAPPAGVKAGPFTVKTTSGNLKPDDDVQVEVTFEAKGDEEFDSKIALWIDGVQGEGSSGGDAGSAGNASASMTVTAANSGSIPGTSVYLLTGQSCVPGINTTDLQTIFEEQFFARTLEDAIAIAGRPDVRVFCEADKIFNFGPVLAYGGPDDVGSVEHFRLTNPKAIPCNVQLSVKPRGDVGDGPRDAKKGGKGPGEHEKFPFEVQPEQIRIPPHASRQVELRFQPSRLSTFGGFLEATVQGGTDPQTNYFSFELRGDGAVPSVSLQPPRLFGDDGGELKLGQLAIGRSHEVRLALRNDGLLPATVHVDPKLSVHFTVSCPSSVSLTKGEQRTFSVSFHPRAAGPMQTELNIRTLGNPFEDVTILLTGEGYSDDICWDLTALRRPTGATGARPDEEPSQAPGPPAPDDLQLGEVAIGDSTQVTFQLTSSVSEALRFQFPEQMPAPFGEQLTVSPRAGFMAPKAQQSITLSFQPTEKLQAEKVPLACKVVSVELLGGEVPGPPSAAEGGEGTASEPSFRPIDGTAKEVPLKLSATADTHALECDVTEICFAPTVMFCTKLYRFSVRNTSTIATPFEWRVQGNNAGVYSVTPQSGTVPASGEQEIELRFAPLEVDKFDCTLECLRSEAARPALEILLAGSAVRPWCHIELPPCDYRSRRQSNVPLDPKYKVLEISSLGTHIKNTKRFYVMNPTAQSIDFRWEAVAPNGQGPSTSDEDTFRCLTKRGLILPSKKFEMVFEFAPQTIETKESFWMFLLLNTQPKVEQHFLVVGTVNEPRIGMDRPNINFGERLLESVKTETVSLVNKEHIPFSFAIDQASYQPEGQPHVVSVTPLNGVVGPNSSLDIEVAFKPFEERSFNYNIFCNVKRKKEPVVLNVKGIGYKIHASLAVTDATGQREITAGLTEKLDFGMLQAGSMPKSRAGFGEDIKPGDIKPGESRTMKLVLRNDSKRNFNFRVQVQAGPRSRLRSVSDATHPPFLSIPNHQGVVDNDKETEIDITYAPLDVHALDGVMLQIAIPAGPTEDMFTLALAGGAKRPRVDFSFTSYDFGPCFCAKEGATMAGEPLATDLKYEPVKLRVTNRDDSDCLISTSFQRRSWLDVQLGSEMIAAGECLDIPIIFTPRETGKMYSDRVSFLINDFTPMHVDVRGRGCPLRLELTDLEMQNIDFGVTTGGQPVPRTVRLINRSPRPVTFELGDESGELAERSVSWSPSYPKTLRPRETCDVELRFAPTYRVAAFRLPLFARCDHGAELKLLQVMGTCHAIEMRLSEHSIFFGNVVVGSQATRPMRLHNFGDLGAKFRFEIPARYGKVFTVAPMEGFVRPQEDIALTVSFHPTHERIQEFRRGERGGATKKGKALPPEASRQGGVDINVMTRDIRCILDGHAPLMLEATGRCVEQPGETKTLEFCTMVRTKKETSFTITNTSDSEWKLHPQVATTDPVGMRFFTCERSEYVIPAKKEERVVIAYLPLTMTAAQDGGTSAPTATPASATSKAARSDKHRGTVFIGTPDGNALQYNLEGIALQPTVSDTLERTVPLKTKKPIGVKVKNWLQEKQRFDVRLELLEPAPSNPNAEGIKLQGVSTFDLPPGAEREYKFSVYAYHGDHALVCVSFTSQDSGEFQAFEVRIKFTEATSQATIHLEAVCRQLVRHKIAVANPLNQPAKFTGTSNSKSMIRFSPEELEVPAHSEKTIDVLFRPVVAGKGSALVTLTSAELGTYPYEVSWTATSAGLERAPVLKAPLGGSVVESFKFSHYASTAVKYKARIEQAPSHKGNVGDFILEKDEVAAPACDAFGEPLSLEFGIRFQPSALGECRSLLVIDGGAGPDGGGEYKALLTGFAQPPQPQGPISILNGKQATVDFRNPFTSPTVFSLQIDNPCFTVPQRSVTINPQQMSQINVTFKSDKVQGGRIIISCDNVSTPWVFFLKGEL